MSLDGTVMLALWAFIMLASGAVRGKHVAVGQGGKGQDKPQSLDMAPNSVDDIYEGCRNKMWAAVMKKYLDAEKKKDKTFNEVWTKAQKLAKKPQHGLTKEHSMAIYVYTLGGPYNFYKDFNGAVRDQKSQYGTTFKYHTVHFLLADAIRILHSNQAEKCLTTYRRSTRVFNRKVLNKEIRFGSFASSSLDTYPSETFGSKSCFKITTCLGSDLTDYAALGSHEREVLIPPYEVFKVTAIQNKMKKKDLECDLEYTLMSAGLRSLLNCALVE